MLMPTVVVSQGIEHPRAPPGADIVRMDTFYSMWRSRSIPDPKGGLQPACETVLLHREDFKIPENMARSDPCLPPLPHHSTTLTCPFP